MIYTVTFNPSLDYIIQVKDFQTGQINKTLLQNDYGQSMFKI